jgi:flagellar hook-basal body complex protein FliE
MSVAGIESIGGFQPLLPPTVRPEATQAPQGPQFGQMLLSGIEGLERMNDNTDNLAVQAATGDLSAIHDYTIAATETSVATQLTVAVRNKAVEAFNEIMRMQVG